MTNLIPWQNLPNWVPGQIHLCSDDLGWNSTGLRSYRYEGQDVIVPAMKDFMLVAYRSGVTPMQRRFDGRWSRETLSPGAVSFLTRAQSAHWTWEEQVDVTHFYISASLMTEVASEVFDCVISDVALEDVLRTVDPVITSAIAALSEEARCNGLGGSIYVDSLTRALIVHLLRHYAQVKTPPERAAGSLSPGQKKRIEDFVDAHQSDALDLSSMASVLGMKPCQFARQFKAAFGMPPYAFVISRRLDRARHLLSGSCIAIKEIAADCGFSDQAHMTRLFRRTYDTTPAEYRKTA